jgi:uncharacterized protein
MTTRRLFLQQIPVVLALPSLVFARTTDTYSHGLLWQVRAGGAPVSHLFGTLHSGDARVLAQADRLRPALAGARIFMPELVTDADAVSAFMAASMSDTDNLPALVGQADWPLVAQQLAVHGVDQRVAVRMRPWAALVTLLQPVAPARTTLDERLVGMARDLGKPVEPLEQVQEQIDAIATLPQATLIALLIDSARRHAAIQDSTGPMTELWLAGDIGGLSRMNEALIAESPALRAHAGRFTRAVLTRRNRRFVQRLQPQLQRGGVVAAFGASHLEGPGGVLSRLAARGMQVTAVAMG